MISGAGFSLIGIVHSILTCNVVPLSLTRYQVQEVSNTLTGYSVTISTDQQGTYNGVPFLNNSVITKVDKQTESIQTTKILKFKAPPSFLKIQCQINE